MHSTITLKPKRDMPLKAGHPWVFSNAIEKEPHAESGDLVRVVAHDGTLLGAGLYHPAQSIRVRMIAREEIPAVSAAYLAERLRALDAQKQRHLPQHTNGYRLVHADADNLPGLIVDRYADVVVFQIHTAAMDRYRAEVVEALKEVCAPRAMVERSDVAARLREGLTELPPKVHLGEINTPVVFEENGVTYLADVMEGQKTGFYLDQREARLRIGAYTRGRRVLNLFSYTGATGLAASLAGAAHVTHVDASKRALELAHEMYTRNNLDPEDEARLQFLRADVFEYLAAQDEGAGYDLIVCDPPAFAKSGRDSAAALKAYTGLNRRCFERLETGGVLVTSSCSGMISSEDFKSALKLAVGQARREAIVLDFFGQPFDHTQTLAYPEGAYLKTFVLEVR